MTNSNMGVTFNYVNLIWNNMKDKKILQKASIQGQELKSIGKQILS